MTPDISVDLMLQALKLVIIIISILIIPSLITGLIVSIFQSATQINEQTLSFLPRVIVTLLTLALTSKWLINQLMDFCVKFFQYASNLLV